MSDVRSKLDDLARTPVLLVASDYDGTLSAIASEPSEARQNREALVALNSLASMPQTHVAVISGRALRDLAVLCGLSGEVHLVGSHGSEFDPDFAQSLPPDLLDLRHQLRDELRTIASGSEEFLVEEKPAGVAFHYRCAEERAATAAVQAVLEGPARRPGVHLKRGKKVIELGIVPSDKGKALAALRHRVGATACLFLGDDLSDEDAFATLCGPDVGIKVGDDETRAAFRVSDSVEAARLLALLAELREAWLKGADAVPIEQHSLLSDQRTVALLTPEARIVWLCLPRIDSPALFAELLGGSAAGFFALRAADGTRPLRQSYLGDTFILQTAWPRFTVTDYLDCSSGRPFQRASRSDLIRVVEGGGPIVLEFAPRLDFSRQPTRLRKVSDGLQVDGSLDPIVLRSPGLSWRIVDDGRHQRAIAEHELTDQPLVLELRHGLSTSNELVVPEPRRREQTARFWTVWAEHLKLPSMHPELVRRSALTLKALCYGPTGAIVAAATTSLPEHVGGVRNWDYRYCWLRDGAMAATALVRLGNTGHGIRLLDWLLGVLDREEAPESLHPLYTVTGKHLGAEGEIGDLPGYRGSRPVRIGNAAAQQLQLDVFGPIMELAAALADSGAALSSEHWRLTEAIVRVVSLRWTEPDHGIWEIRGARQHYVHSKIMCWLAVDRAIRIAQVYTGLRPDAWSSLREQIAADVLRHGWNEQANSFTAIYDGEAMDAAALHVGLSGLLSADDPRFVDTVLAVERTLRRESTVHRYLYDDGLPGREGGFHLCTAWLIEAYARIGRMEAARDLLEQFVTAFGPTGLAPEEYCSKTRHSLGNHPQAYTHVGLINAVLALESMNRNSIH